MYSISVTVLLFILLLILSILFVSFLLEEYNKSCNKSCDNYDCKDTEWHHVCCSEEDKSEWIPKEDN